MFVSHFNSFLDGGAATAARRLHAELTRKGVDSRFYYLPSQGSRSELDGTYHPARWTQAGWRSQLNASIRFRKHRQAFKRVARGRPAGHEIFSSPQGSPYTAWPPAGHPRSDELDTDAEASAPGQIINLHWIAKFLDYASFFGSLDPGQPVVWTLHDMNAFTGGCHFSEGCEGYRTGCGNCPQLPNRSPEDFSRQFFEQKSSAIENVNLHIVAPSRWLIDSARSSHMFRAAESFTHIPYGISTTDYYPMDRVESRLRLGIDPDAMVFCFGAMDVKSRRKGAKELLQALSSVADLPNVQGIVFGSGQLPETTHRLPPLHQVGPVRGLLEQRTLYSACDVFVLPSLEDNLPLTGLEAMACGAAVVGFDAGGIPDYVTPNETGLLAPVGDAVALGRNLRFMAQNRAAAAAMGRTARAVAIADYSDEREAKDYVKLYAALLDAAGSPV